MTSTRPSFAVGEIFRFWHLPHLQINNSNSFKKSKLIDRNNGLQRKLRHVYRLSVRVFMAHFSEQSLKMIFHQTRENSV